MFLVGRGSDQYPPNSYYPSPTAWAVTTIVLDESSLSVSVNGSTPLVNSTNAEQPNMLAIGGGRGAQSGGASTVDVGELLVYRRVLSPQEVARVEEYLMFKWRISTRVTVAALPASVPTTDVFNTKLVKSQFAALTSLGTSFVRRALALPLDSSIILSLTANVQQVSSSVAVLWFTQRCVARAHCMFAFVSLVAGVSVLGHLAVGHHLRHVQRRAAHRELCRHWRAV